MIYKIMNTNVDVDFTMIVLNATSFGTLALAWMTEHMTGIMGGFVLFTVGVLNLAKAYAYFRGRNIKK